MPQPRHAWPVSLRIRQSDGSSRSLNRNGRFGPEGSTNQEQANPASSPDLAQRLFLESDLSQALMLHVAEFVNDDHLSLFAARTGDYRPNDSPKQAGEDGQNRMQGVVDGFALDQHRLEIALGLDAQTTADGLLYLLCQHRLSFFGRAIDRAYRRPEVLGPFRPIPISLLTRGIGILVPPLRAFLARMPWARLSGLVTLDGRRRIGVAAAI